MSTVFFTIVIPTYQRNDLLSLCLDRLNPETQSFVSELYEVIITDDGRNNSAEELIKSNYPWAKWVQGPRKGPAANRNNGAEHAQGEWLVFIDDDCLPDIGILHSYAQAIDAHDDVCVFEGRIYVDRPKQRHDEESPINETGGYLWSCNFCIQKVVFDNMNGFDETYPHAAMEDVDFHYRLKEMRHEIVFLRDAAVLHPWRKFGGFKGEIRKVKSVLHYLAKHPKEQERLNRIFYLRAIYHTLRKCFVNFSIFGFRGISYVPIRILVVMYAIFAIKRNN